MQKTATISTKISFDLKQNVEKILNHLGLTTNQAIMVFLKQVELQQGLPFSVKIPNETTLQAIEESRDINKLDHFKNVRELYEDMGI